jgi:peptide/nickel transport system substrate-binding protein
MKFVAINCKAGDIMSLKELTALVKTERISRREFVQLSIAAGVSAAAGLSSFAKILRAAPKRGGYFRAAIGHGSTTDTLDPATWNNSFDGDLGQGIYGNTLLAINLKNDAVADLVESYEGTSGLKVWVFRLRKGITFHNGKSLTAEDVVASFNHHRGSNSKSVVKSLLTNIDSITADGKYSVVFTL